MRGGRAARAAAGVAGLAWLLAGGAVPAAERAPAPDVLPARDSGDPFAEVRGMTVSTPGAGEDWGSDAMVRTLGVLAELGCNWVAIHPYGGIREDGAVGRSRIDGMYDDPAWLTRAIDAAHAQGLKILIKPHLAYWGTRFSWRGEIAFDDEEQWRRFFDTYREWIVRVAALYGRPTPSRWGPSWISRSAARRSGDRSSPRCARRPARRSRTARPGTATATSVSGTRWT
jgi:hypothetical protein